MGAAIAFAIGATIGVGLIRARLGLMDETTILWVGVASILGLFAGLLGSAYLLRP